MNIEKKIKYLYDQQKIDENDYNFLHTLNLEQLNYLLKWVEVVQVEETEVVEHKQTIHHLNNINLLIIIILLLLLTTQAYESMKRANNTCNPNYENNLKNS